MKIAGLVLVALFWTGLATAADVAGLYEAEVPVASRSPSDQEAAARAALVEVLIKVSGRGDAALAPGMDVALRNPSRLLQQFRYQDSVPVAPLTEGARPPQVLWCQFDPEAVNRELTRVGLPVWGRTRPTTLVWLVIQRDGQRFLADASAAAERRVLEMQGRRHGLALLLPLHDLEDQIALPAAELWGGFQEPILAASQRYRAESVLVGRLDLGPAGAWSGRWTLYQDAAPLHWNSQGEQFELVVAAGMAGAMENLAARYATVLSGTDVIRLMVTGVHTARDYARLSRYLQSIETIAALQVAEVEGDRVTFRAQLRGDLATLSRNISLGNVLDPAEAGAAPGAAVHAYRLRP